MLKIKFLFLFFMCSLSILNSQEKEKMIKKNHLANETSPYLLQHATNPVDWYPWGEEAFEKAKKEDKPVFLSIGYSACHWCHVMEEESFKNEEIAKILNDFFICIKVDREEYPDVDAIYMESVRLQTGSGGWPMSVFLTTEKKPFFGGTYFPPADSGGRPGFKNVLLKISEAWKNQKPEIIKGADTITKAIIESTQLPKMEAIAITEKHFEGAFEMLKANFDSTNGGFSRAPKFPSASTVQFLIRQSFFSGNEEALAMAEKTLLGMAKGGLYDQIGGGFHRYSVDNKWQVPHFEKMLYDNAQLVSAYCDAYLYTKNEFYGRVAKETLNYVIKKMQSPEGGYYASEDADSEGEEGRYYLWEKAEIDKALSVEEAALCNEFYQIKSKGNFVSSEKYHQNKNILHTSKTYEEFAKEKNIDTKFITDKFIIIHKKLIEIREKRVRPNLDTKVIAAWNGLMIAGMAKGYQAFQNKEYKESAINAGNFILDKLKKEILFKTYRNKIAKIPGDLNDYSMVISGFLSLYEITFDEKWVVEAKDLQTILDRDFTCPEGGYFLASVDKKDLIARQKPYSDDAIPSGNNVEAINLQNLYHLTGENIYLEKAKKIITLYSAMLIKYPIANMKMMEAISIENQSNYEIVIVGVKPLESEPMIKELYQRYIPNRILCFRKDTGDYKGAIVLLKDRPSRNKKSTVYVCKGYVCHMPADNLGKFWENLNLDKKKAILK